MRADSMTMVASDRPTALASRRSFLGGAAALGAGLAVAGSMTMPRRAAAGVRAIGQPIEMDTKFATVVPINSWLGGGVWAIVSKWGPTFTLCNGGIIAGKDAVVLIDGYNTLGGAQWAAEMAKKLTGRDVTHVIVTHYHSDHTDGLSGYLALREPPLIVSTQATRDLMAKRGAAGGGNLFFPAPESTVAGLKRSVARCVLPDTVMADSKTPLTIDIGGKTIVLRERSGHTPSDLTIEVEGAGKDGETVIYAGDLVFNKVFPVYLDALPKAWHTHVSEVVASGGGKSVIVPGHGQVTTADEIRPLLGVFEAIAAAAAKAHASGTSAQQAAKGFVMPESLKEYATDNAVFVQLAFEASYREIEGK